MVIAMRERWRIVATAAIVSAGIVAVALLLGSGQNVLSFITEQTGRGLQVEAPVTTIWLWRALAGELDTFVYFDMRILTYQVQGDGTELRRRADDAPAARRGRGGGRRARLPVAAPGCAARRPAARARARTGHGASSRSTRSGSPQFASWLAVPIVLGIATHIAGTGRSFRTPGAIVLVIAGLTQLIYPYLYDELLNLNVLMVIALTARNLLYFVLLGLGDPRGRSRHRAPPPPTRMRCGCRRCGRSLRPG